MNQENAAIEAEEPASEQSDEEVTTKEVEKAEVSEEGEQREEAATSEDDTETDRHRKGGVQKRIDELTRQRYEAVQRADAAERLAKQFQQQAVNQSHSNSKPTLEQYGYDQDAWAIAYEQWVEAGQQRAQEESQRASQEMQAQQAYMAQQQRVNEKVYQAQQKYPDFLSKIQDPTIPPLRQISPAAYDAVTESDAMGDIAYYLASNPSEVYRFGQMSPVQAIKEVAKLEVKLTAKPAAMTKRPPAPPSELDGRTDKARDPSKMTMEEYAEWWNNRKR